MKKRLTEEQIKEIRRLKESGIKAKELKEKFGVSQYTINYWTNETIRENQKKKASKWFKGLSKSKKSDIYQKRKEYLRNYYKNRYRNDEEFRKRQIKAVIDSRNRIERRKDNE
jgi:hypothetical protein